MYFQPDRVDFVQLMVNARENNLKTSEFEVNADQDGKNDSISDARETHSAANSGKGMTIEVRNLRNDYSSTTTTQSTQVYFLNLFSILPWFIVKLLLCNRFCGLFLVSL